jgi:hypothetical protein
MLLAGPLVAIPAAADQHGDGQHMQQGQHGKMHGKQGKMHGKQGCSMGKHGAGHADSWKGSLTDEQRARLKQMHVELAKVRMPLKARAKAIKVELAVQATSDTPDLALMDDMLDELMALKKQMKRAHYLHMFEVRKMLDDEQRAGFDMHVLNKAAGKKKSKGHH